MKILVTGASGQLGLSIREASFGSDHEFVFTDVVADGGGAVLDVTDEDAVTEFVSEGGFAAIVNCAAYTDVDKAESDQENARKLNALAPGILAKAAAGSGALLIHISTDYVFDGTACRPYAEDAEAVPVNVYGRTKLEGENAVKASGCRYLILRTSWMYSNYGRNFFRRMVELTAERPELKVVADQIGTPTWASDLADAVVEILDSGKEYESGVYNYSGEGVCSWYDFAKEICSGVGHLCDIKPCSTEDYPSAARRPAFSVLDKAKFKNTFGIEIPHWRESLMCCINLRQE